MLKHFKKYLTAYKGDNYRPRIATKHMSGFLVTFLFILLGFTFVYSSYIRSNEHFLSAVLPSVLVDLANNDRQKYEIHSLTINPLLEKAALLKAEHMARSGYFAHTSPEGYSPWYWLREVGYQYVAAGENLAVHFSDSEYVEKAWMSSPLHRANILNSGFTEIGIATAEGFYEGKKTVFIVQMFGKPPNAGLFNTQPISTYQNEHEDVLGTSTVMYSSVSERTASKPLTLLQYVYIGISFVLGAALCSMLIRESLRKYSLSVLYLLGALCVAFVCMMLLMSLVFPKTLIAVSY